MYIIFNGWSKFRLVSGIPFLCRLDSRFRGNDGALLFSSCLSALSALSALRALRVFLLFVSFCSLCSLWFMLLAFMRFTSTLKILHSAFYIRFCFLLRVFALKIVQLETHCSFND